MIFSVMRNITSMEVRGDVKASAKFWISINITFFFVNDDLFRHINNDLLLCPFVVILLNERNRKTIEYFNSYVCERNEKTIKE